MTEEEAIKIIYDYWNESKMPHSGSVGLRIIGLEEFRNAAEITSKLARECLERRKQPSIAQVLDELEEHMHQKDWHSAIVREKMLQDLGSKFCAEPAPEKPTLKGICEEFIKLARTSNLAGTPLRDACFTKLLDQLKEVE